jgi:hypothetical protein
MRRVFRGAFTEAGLRGGGVKTECVDCLLDLFIIPFHVWLCFVTRLVLASRRIYLYQGCILAMEF